ncbi:MAG: HEAT repeat domain-containing protein [Planctomycetota bacterium]|nr:HEAT repeat domain-containing protein [Planctomycetota bacterium]
MYRWPHRVLLILVVGNLNPGLASEEASKDPYPDPAQLVQTLGEMDDDAKISILRNLKSQGVDAAPSVPALLDLLGKFETSANVKYEVVATLAEIGEAAKEAVPGLTAGLTSEDPHLRGWCARALGCIGPDAASAVPALIQALQDQVVGVQRLAAEALGRIGPRARSALVGLRSLENAANASLRVSVKSAIQQIQRPERE